MIDSWALLKFRPVYRLKLDYVPLHVTKLAVAVKMSKAWVIRLNENEELKSVKGSVYVQHVKAA